jgi:hypothetical protein
MAVLLHTSQRKILNKLRYVRYLIPDDGTYEVPKYLGDLLAYYVCETLCM